MPFTSATGKPLMSDFKSDCVVIGAGVVGLAVARELAKAGREVIILEQDNRIGSGISSRNSEVIHAGIYYPPGSLKARFCVEGNKRLYAYCNERHIPHKNCGKLIVATSDAQLPKLKEIHMRAMASGAHDLYLVGSAEIKAIEPEVRGIAGLFSPSTGIVDSHTLMTTLLGDVENAGGALSLNAPVETAEIMPYGMALYVGGKTPCSIKANFVVNAAGLGAIPLLKKMRGFPAQRIPPAYYAKGNYFTLSNKSPFTHLVYPLPTPGGLGVHATLDMGGNCRFGPDVEWVKDPDDFTVDPDRAGSFYASIRDYWPGLPDNSLHPGYCGIRPKLHPASQANADFSIQNVKNHRISSLVNLLGIESPGLTAALAIAAHVKDLLH